MCRAHRVPVGGVGPLQPGARPDDAGAMPQHHRDGDAAACRPGRTPASTAPPGHAGRVHRGRPADGRRCWSAPWSRSRCWPGCLRCHGRRPAASAKPPHRLTTRSPSTQTATAAPMSSRSVKLRMKASRTLSKPGAHEPFIVTSAWSSTNPPARGADALEQMLDIAAFLVPAVDSHGSTAVWLRWRGRTYLGNVPRIRSSSVRGSRTTGVAPGGAGGRVRGITLAAVGSVRSMFETWTAPNEEKFS